MPSNPKEQTAPALFAPQLFIPAGVTDISFYTKALSAVLVREWRNEDNSIHVAELAIGGSVFQVHEERPGKGQLEPGRAKGVTALMGLFVPDVDAVMEVAVRAGAVLVNPAQDYDYGYRQGTVKDPFGHHWMIEMKIDGFQKSEV